MTKLRIDNRHYRFYKDDHLNSIHDIPSWQDISGNIIWHKNGELHRLNGPARIYYDGEKEWWENGGFIKMEYFKSD